VLVPTSRRKQADGSKYQKCSIDDSRNKFLIWKSTIGELQDYISGEVNSCFGNKTSFQPLICCIGSGPHNLEHFYVYVSGIFYKQPNILSALDLCFKVFFILNLKYPKECVLVWTFVQKYFFDIDLDTDIKSRSLSEFINDLKQ